MSLGKIAVINMRLRDHEPCVDPHASVLNDVAFLDSVLSCIAEICGLTVLSTSHHEFMPYGVTICKILSESHISIHTWPELQSCAIDVYSCRDDLDEVAIEAYLRAHFDVEHLTSQVHVRRI